MGKGFSTHQPLEHMKYAKKCQNAIIGTYLPMGRQIEGLIVGVLKHAYYGSSSPLVPISFVHAYGHVWKMRQSIAF